MALSFQKIAREKELEVLRRLHSLETAANEKAGLNRKKHDKNQKTSKPESHADAPTEKPNNKPRSKETVAVAEKVAEKVEAVEKPETQSVAHSGENEDVIQKMIQIIKEKTDHAVPLKPAKTTVDDDSSDAFPFFVPQTSQEPVSSGPPSSSSDTPALDGYDFIIVKAPVEETVIPTPFAVDELEDV